jgi:hypothetical protein
MRGVQKTTLLPLRLPNNETRNVQQECGEVRCEAPTSNKKSCWKKGALKKKVRRRNGTKSFKERGN